MEMQMMCKKEEDWKGRKREKKVLLSLCRQKKKRERETKRHGRHFFCSITTRVYDV